MAHNLNKLFYLHLFLCLAHVSCQGGGYNRETAPSHIVISVSQSEITSKRGKAEIEMTISDFSNLDYLQIDKETQYGWSSMKQSKSTIADTFTYEYLVKETDPESITLTFCGIDTNGESSDKVSVHISNPKDLNTKSVTISNLKCISRVTGNEDNGHDNLPPVLFSVQNRTDLKYDVGGTDLGIGWQIDERLFGFFFGDTFGKDFRPSVSGPGGSNWRSNVLLFSQDTVLNDGLRIDGAAMDGHGARQICYSAHITTGNGDYTSIPTAAVHANGAEYVHYMNIKNWDGWVTNNSGLYKSKDNGQTWEKVNKVSFAGESNFGQAGYFKKDGIVYMIATKTGRDHSPYLARFAETDIENTDEYEFWNGSGWIKGREATAQPLYSDPTGELSFAYMPLLDKWILTYFSSVRYEIALRYANNPEGPWSSPIQVASGSDWPQLYGSFIHPLSTKSNKLYFIMSMWYPYNTYLMSLDLELTKKFSN
jgi:hypothetical protein